MTAYVKPRSDSPLLRILCVVLAFTACVLGAGQTPVAAQQQRPRLTSSLPAPPQMVRKTSSEAEEVSENDVVRVNTQLITVPVVVRDHDGRPVTGLTAAAFQLYEDGLPQRVATFGASDAPFEIALLLDTSGSTRAEIALIRGAAEAFIQCLRPNDRVAVISFTTSESSQGKIATVAVQRYLTDDRNALEAAVQSIGSSNGTPYYDGLDCVMKDVFGDPATPEMRGRRALVALTDGVDSSSVAGFSSIRKRFLATGLLAYFIEIDTENYVEDRLLVDCDDDRSLRLSRAQLERYRQIFNPNARSEDYADFCRLGSFERMEINRSLYKLARAEMGQLARDTGGKTFQAAGLDAARNAFAEVAAEIGRQYSIGYYSTNPLPDGSFRAIRVTVPQVTGAQVSARAGYSAVR